VVFELKSVLLLRQNWHGVHDVIVRGLGTKEDLLHHAAVIA
jgi:hypothetical protein